MNDEEKKNKIKREANKDDDIDRKREIQTKQNQKRSDCDVTLATVHTPTTLQFYILMRVDYVMSCVICYVHHHNQVGMLCL